VSETLARTARLPAWRGPAAAAARAAGGPLPTPLIAVLCTVPRGRVAAAGVALALARAMGRACALAGTVGEDARGPLVAVPSAHRAAGSLRERGLSAVAGGRLVQLADRRGRLSDDDVAGRAAAMSAELGRSAAALGAPAAVAFPFARTAALDRVLAWHDAIVVVREPDAAGAAIECALESLAQLGRPVAAMAPPARLPGMLAAGGVRAPVEALQAVAGLALGDGRSGRSDA
jgi:hypothetical protein